MADVDTYTDSGFLDGGEKLGAKRGSGGVRVLSNRFPYYSAASEFTVPWSGRFKGGFGAASTSAGVNDWNDISNAHSGSGARLMNAGANPPHYGGYYHPFSFEYNTKTGAGNLTQFAIPYANGGIVQLRFRFSNVWSDWKAILMQDSAGNFRPPNDDQHNLGQSNFRFDNIYASNGTVQTSDARLKVWRSGISEKEYEAGLEIMNFLGFFQWQSAVEAKGKNKARYHFGAQAQQIWEVMANHGLVAPLTDGKPGKTPYAFLCYDAWEDEFEPILKDRIIEPEEKDADGNIIKQAVVEQVESGEKNQTQKAGDRFGVKYDELNTFLLACQNRRQNELEDRLATLESGS